MSLSETPAPPPRITPDSDWEHDALYQRVRDAILSLPFYFKTETVIAGVMATDIFTLNATLGATIEDQVVRTLNDMRQIWDPDNTYRLYGFVRQPQTFPDVLLRRLTHEESVDAIILGLELKGWYLVAKEGEPSFRFTATAAACNPQDMIVIVPWVLSNVISGSPRVHKPYVESLRYAAEYRNHHWQHLRDTKLDTGIAVPPGISPYPRKSDQISDRPVADGGGNFGRFARTGIMNGYIEAAKSELLCGVEARHWLTFFKVFQEKNTRADIEKELVRFGERVSKTLPAGETLASVRTILGEIGKLTNGS